MVASLSTPNLDFGGERPNTTVSSRNSLADEPRTSSTAVGRRRPPLGDALDSMLSSTSAIHVGGKPESNSIIELPRIGPFATKLQVTQGYLDAISAPSVPTLGFGLKRSQSMPSDFRANGAPPPGPSSTIPCPAGRRAIRSLVKQRQEHGPAHGSNLQGPRAGNVLTVTEEVRKEMPHVANAAGDFVRRHNVRSGTASALMTALSHVPSSLRFEDGFYERLDDVRRNRFILPPRSLAPLNALPVSGEGRRYAGSSSVSALSDARTEVGHHPVRVRQKAKYNLATSVWRPRKLTGNSKDFFDTAASLQKIFDASWSLACRARRGFIQKLIVKAEYSDGISRDADGNGVDDEVEQVSAVLSEHCRTIFASYDYYASAGVSASNSTSIGAEHEIYDVCQNGYLMFVRDCKLANKECPASLLNLIFAEVDAKDDDTSADDNHNKTRMLNRQEWLQALVRIALEKYVRTKKVPDVSDAVERLCREDLLGLLPDAALQDSNSFREQYCYNEHMERVLRKHMGTLKSLYSRYADLQGSRPGVGEYDSSSLMSIGEWMEMLSQLSLFSSGQITMYEGKLIFSWSRIRAVIDNSHQSVVKARTLYFEDFMEAIIRLSLLCALPTDEDLAEVGAEDAGVYLLALAAHAPSQHRSFLQQRRGSLTKRPRQVAWRCADHLMRYIARLIEMNTSGGKDVAVSADEAAQFVKRHQSGRELVQDAVSLSQVSTKSMHQTAFATALRKVRERTLASLAKVGVFSSLSSEQQEALLDSMVYAPYHVGELVFDQGDSGDSFYAILSGSASVLRTQDDGRVVKLATLNEGACFGERALLTDEARFASVRATTKLSTVSISREGFEALFGEGTLTEAFRSQVVSYSEGHVGESPK